MLLAALEKEGPAGKKVPEHKIVAVQLQKKHRGRRIISLRDLAFLLRTLLCLRCKVSQRKVLNQLPHFLAQSMNVASAEVEFGTVGYQVTKVGRLVDIHTGSFVRDLFLSHGVEGVSEAANVQAAVRQGGLPWNCS